MPRYRVNSRYYSEHNGRRFGPYKAGSEVELEERDAEWVNRDSPGTLVEARPEPAKAGKAAAKKAAKPGGGQP